MRQVQLAVMACATVLVAVPALAQPSPEPTDVFIRRLAGLPAATALGHIRITDVGHHPGDTMLSIVGNRTKAGWVVSFACAASSYCANGVDHAARRYTLSASANAEVDQILATLRTTGEPEGKQPVSALRGGQLSVAIDYNGFQRSYQRTSERSELLGKLETLMRGEPNRNR